MTTPDSTSTADEPFALGEWTVNPRDGTLRSDRGTERLEPRVMSLLTTLARAGDRMVPREELMRAVWGDTVVGDDALARCVLKLRRSLGDDARTPRYLETVPKRGYRLLEAPRSLAATGLTTRKRSFVATALSLGVLVAGLTLVVLFGGNSEPNESTAAVLERAHDHYYRFSRAGNESAGRLYQELLQEQPDLAAAKAGLANVLVQRALRWPAEAPPVPLEEQTIGAALQDGRLDTPWAVATLDHARTLAREAVAADPDNALAHKALGLVLAVSGQDERARTQYRQALAIDPGMWEAWLNLGELRANAGDAEAAVTHYIRAYEAMEQRYAEDAQRIGPWQAELGALIGQTFAELGRPEPARLWFQRVLAHSPFHAGATAGLASVLAGEGEEAGAQALCAELVLRIGPLKECVPYLSPDHREP